jgi:hypothetical protein
MGDKSDEDFIIGCPTVPVVRGSEVRFSITEPERAVRLRDWPLAYVSCGEIAPPQTLRTQWGVPASGPRYDSYSGMRIGSSKWNLTLGSRTTYSNAESPISQAEQQRVGVAEVTMGGRVRFKYWNDHKFWWWPLGDGGDQGDTAGLQFSYNLRPHRLVTHGWRFDDLHLTLRLATGIPNRNSAVAMGDGSVYSEVRFNEINRGDIDLSTSLTGRRAQKLEVGILLNADSVRHATQDRVVHRPLGIPEFPQTGRVEGMLYLRLTNW